MYPGEHGRRHPDQPALIMANSGEQVTYAEFEARTNQLANLYRAAGLTRGDHVAILMENHLRYYEPLAAAERSGLYYTSVNTYLTPAEAAYIVDNCDAKVFVTTLAQIDTAVEAAKLTPKVETFLCVGAAEPIGPFLPYDAAIAQHSPEPIADEELGTMMPYSSGTTGTPKGILRPLPDLHPGDPMLAEFPAKHLYGMREGMTYLSPAPLYHSAPQASVGFGLRLGATSIIMEKFDAEQFLELIERYQVTHTQVVPTMFSRLLKLPEAVRTKYDLSSLEMVSHAAAPCPVPVKQAMIDWLGPIVLEYYGSSEANGCTLVRSDEWLAHPGTVGKAYVGELLILDDDGNEVPTGTDGTVWFEGATNFTYYQDDAKTAESRDTAGTRSTVGDVGYVDEEGYLYLTDRRTNMIISGGVNIYPQEAENLLITHPLVADAAVIGVPNEDLGEEVKAVVQLEPGVPADDATAAELIEFCRQNLAHYKCPRSVDFDDELPRLPTGKLYKGVLKDRYWDRGRSRIV